jgi:adenosylcobinamide-phosphate synthase
MFTYELFGGGRALDPFVLLFLALAVDAVLPGRDGLFRILPHPVAWLGGLVNFLERKLNREHRPPMDRAVRGAIVVIVAIFAALALAWVVLWVGELHPYGWLLEAVLLVTLLAQRSLYTHVRDVRRALESGGLIAGRTAVAHIVGRDPEKLDDHGVARAAVESCAENFSDGVVAPVFWYVLFGLPGIVVYKAVNTLDSMIGHKSDRYRAFGFVAARLDDVLNLVPARLAGLMIALAAFFVPTASPGRSLKIMLRDGAKHRSPNAGWPEAAAAGALDIALSGPRFYTEGSANEPWLGDGRAQLVPSDIGRMLYLYWVACLIQAMVVAALVVARLSQL